MHFSAVSNDPVSTGEWARKKALSLAECTDKCWTTAYLTPASLEYTGNAERGFFTAGFLRLLKSGRITCHTLKVVSPMYDNEDRIYFSAISAVSNESRQRREEWAREKAVISFEFLARS